MNDWRDVAALVRPIRKGWWLILLCLAPAVALGLWSVYRMVPTYQATATLKINDKESGASEFLENFERFSSTGRLLTEVEGLKSRYLPEVERNLLDPQLYFRYYLAQVAAYYLRLYARVPQVLMQTHWLVRTWLELLTP